MQLEQNTAKRPDVTCFTSGLVVDALRRHVLSSAHKVLVVGTARCLVLKLPPQLLLLQVV